MSIGYFYSIITLTRKIIKILTRSLLVLLGLLIAVWLLVQTSFIQNWLIAQAAQKLSKELNTEVSVRQVDFSLFDKMLMEGVLVKDRSKDTLAYIGRVGVNITDWFFFKEKVELKYISVEQTTVFLHRADSIWNYQFLLDYFSSPGTKDTTKKGIQLSLKKAELSNIHVIQKDEWRGETMDGKIGLLKLDMKEFNLPGKRIQATLLNIVSPSFAIYNYQGKRPRKPSRPDEDYHTEDVVNHWNEEGWNISVKNVTITNGEFKNELFTERQPFSYFDPAHLQFKQINGQFVNFQFAGDTMQAAIKLSAKERSGFDVKQLTANMLWHPTGMEFRDLDAETNKSRLRNYFAMRYTQFNHDMSEFITHVTMEGNFEDSEIHSDDIAFFAPELNDWKDRISVNGKVKGTVNHLKGSQVIITSLKNTIFDGDFTIDGLPDINSTFLDLRANLLQTSYADASAIYPGLKKINEVAVSKIDYLRFKGSFTGYIKDFVTYGTIQTNLGTLVTDINLKLPEKGEPIYSGKLKTDGFEIGTFLKDPLFGRIVMDGSLKGRGFKLKTLFAEIDGKIKAADINGYTYQNIDAKGIFEKRKFDGALVVNDPNLKINITGLVDLNKDTPMYKVNGDIYEINFKPLGLSRSNLSLKAYADLDFKGKTIDDFLGTANISNASLTRDGEPLSFEYLTLSSVIVDGKKELIAHSNEADVTIRGVFNILDLPTTTLSFLHNYFPAYIALPKKTIRNQDFTFDIVTKKIAPFISIWSVPVEGFDYSTINGRINTTDKLFNLETNVPLFTYTDKYNHFSFNNVRIKGNGDYHQLNLQGTLDQIQLNDSLSLPQSEFHIVAANDTGLVNIKTRASQTLKEADLNAHISTTRDGVALVFQTSTLVLNDKIWTIENNSDLFIGKKQIHSDAIRISSGTEKILAYTQPSATGNSDDFILELTKIRIDDIMPYFLKDPRLEGVVTGQVDILNPFGKMQIEANISAEEFRFNNDSIGVVQLKGNFSEETGDINTEIISDNPLNEFFSSGKINIKDPKKPVIDQVAEIKHVQLSLLQKYLSIIMTGMKGTGSGVINIKGDANQPELIGNVQISNASFVLDYTKCRYFIKEGTTINFKEGQLDFGTISLRDTSGRMASFSGKLYHKFFRDMRFDMNFRTNDDKRGLLVLNTTKKDNSLFYGHVVARASGSITGPSNNIVLKLQGEPTDSSRVFLPTTDSRVTGTADFIVFRKYGKEMKVESQIKESSSLLVDLDIIANPLAKIDLILDEITNDVIQGQGDGFLNIRVGTYEKTSMNGRFNISNGRYTFNWQALIKKPFDISRGTVEWNGDPYDAKINIDAKYTTPKISLPSDLAIGCTSNDRSEIIVVSNLSNTLKNPVINFRFELPQDHPCRNNPITISGFQRLYNNPNELNNQVFSLLFFNQFLSSNPNTSAAGSNLGSNIISTAAGTISEFIAQQVTSGLGLALKNIPGINKLALDPYVTFTPGLISGTQAQTSGFYGTSSFGITRRLLNGRLLLKAGGSVLVNTGQATVIQNNNQLTPDITLEWLITPDGKLRIIGFYRSIYDVQWRTANRTGISFSYVKDFD